MRIPLAVIAVVLAAVGLSGCGGSSSSSSGSSAPEQTITTTASGGGSGSSATNGVAGKSAAQIVAAAQSAARSASSVHVAGAVASGEKIDLDLARGRGGKGSLTEGGASVQLIRIGQKVYIKGSQAFYRRVGGAAAAKLLQGKWLKAPASAQDMASLVSVTDLNKLLGSLLGSHGKLAKGGTTTVDGQQVVAVKDVTKGGTLYVATTGKPYPVELSSTKGGSGGQVTFDRWDQPVSLAPPANVVDLSNLKP